MIQPAPSGSARNPIALVKCDDCGVETVETAYYAKSHHRDEDWELDEGQLRKRLTKQGWTFGKGGKTCRCPSCVEKLREDVRSKMPPVTTPAPVTTELRQPTRAQKREIISLLGDVYDIKTERYLRGETDKTVAETIGGGCMPGWVAQIREEMFGPDGGNEEVEALQRELERLTMEVQNERAAIDAHFEKQSTKIEALASSVTKAQQRLEALKAAVGPKAARV